MKIYLNYSPLVLRVSWVLRYRYAYTIALVVVTFALNFTQNLAAQVGAIFLIVVVGLALTRAEHQESRIQSASDQFKTLLGDQVFPRIESDYETVVDNAPDIRVNVMLSRRRHILAVTEYLKYPPWQPTLKIEAFYGDYPAHGEDELCWKLHQGVVGSAMNKEAQEAWSDLDQPPEVVKTEWQMTDKQIDRTRHLNSVLSTPIYLPSDTEKDDPVGVLNLDSRANLSGSKFDHKSVRDTAIYWSNIIGAIVE